MKHLTLHLARGGGPALIQWGGRGRSTLLRGSDNIFTGIPCVEPNRRLLYCSVSCLLPMGRAHVVPCFFRALLAKHFLLRGRDKARQRKGRPDKQDPFPTTVLTLETLPDYLHFANYKWRFCPSDCRAFPCALLVQNRVFRLSIITRLSQTCPSKWERSSGKIAIFHDRNAAGRVAGRKTVVRAKCDWH